MSTPFGNKQEKKNSGRNEILKKNFEKNTIQ